MSRASVRTRMHLHETVFRATTLGPRIVRAMVKAAHGPDAERLARLTEAEEMCRQLAGHIADIKLRVKLEQEAAQAQQETQEETHA